MSNIYNSKFVSAVRAILVIGCADGARLSREEICERLAVEGFDTTPDTLKSAMSDGAFNSQKQAWALFAGRFGGVRELDLEATAQLHAEAEARQAKIDARIAKRLATVAARKTASVATPTETQATV